MTKGGVLGLGGNGAVVLIGCWLAAACGDDGDRTTPDAGTSGAGGSDSGAGGTGGKGSGGVASGGKGATGPGGASAGGSGGTGAGGTTPDAGSGGKDGGSGGSAMDGGSGGATGGVGSGGVATGGVPATGGNDAGSDGSAPSDASIDASIDANDGAPSEAGLPDVDAACSDNDANNCGRPGHDCGGGACVCGRCQPIVLASGIDPGSLAIDDTSIFFRGVDTYSIFKLSQAGGAPVTLATGQAIPVGVTVFGDHVYWTNKSNITQTPSGPIGAGSVARISKSGGAVETLAAGQLAPLDVKVNANGVFWVNSADTPSQPWGQIMTLPEFQPPVTMASGVTYPRTLAVDATFVYFPDEPASGHSIQKVPIRPGPAVPFLSGTGNGFVGMSSFVLDAERLYFRAGVYGKHMIRAAPLSGAPAVDLVTGLTEVGGIAVDATYVYFTERTSRTVNRVPISGGPPEVLATSPGSPYALAVDGKYVFWSDPGDQGARNGAILKVVKSP